MHQQLPGTVLTKFDVDAPRHPQVTENKAVVLDRLVLNRPGRKVKFYFRNNRFKRCYSDLSEDQVKALTMAVHKNTAKTAINFVFDDDHYTVTPSTKRFVK
jgi:hypothetical protein